MDVATQHEAAKFWLDRANEARLAAQTGDRQTVAEMTAIAALYQKLAENVVSRPPANETHPRQEQAAAMPWHRSNEP